MKNRLHRLIALGIVTVLAVSTVAFTSQDSFSGLITFAAEESETETETETPAPETDPPVVEETPAPEPEPEPEPVPEPEEPAAEEPGETLAEPADEDAGIVSSDWETVTADVGVVGEEIIVDVYNKETDPDTGEPVVADPGADTGETEAPQEETDPEETEETESETEDEEGVAANIIGFAVDPSQYPAADASANTRYIYNYLTRTMGFNHAAACGILANIQMESGFNPLALGDGGTSYGICQWHNERFNSLISYCNSIGLDYNTLDGQLANLNRELTGSYSSIYSYFMGVPDTAQGAYDAGYYWCVYFEIPNNATSHGALRGNLASNEYYPLDLSMDESEEMPVEDSIFRLREDMALQSEGWAVNTEEDGSVIFSFPEIVLINKSR